MKPNSKSSIAYDYIAQAIYNQELIKESMLEPETSLAKKLKISRVTLRRAIDKLVLEGMLEKIPNKGYKVLGNFSPNRIQSKKNILLFAHAYKDEIIKKDLYHMAIWKGIQKCAHENEYIPKILSLPSIEEIQKQSKFIGEKCAGIICDISMPEKISLLETLQTPLVMVDCVGESKNNDMVIQDNFGGIKKAFAELAKRNAKKIGYLDPSLKLKIEMRDLHALEREQSFIQSAATHNYSKNTFVIEKSTMDSSSVKKALIKLFNENIDGLILPFSEFIKEIETSFWNNLPNQMKIIIWGDTKISHKNIIYLGQLKWDPIIMGHESVLRLIQRIKQPNLNAMKILVPVNLSDGIAISATKTDF